jgi:putative hydrolase of the HAD superfamily
MIKAVIFDCFGVLIMPGQSLSYRDYPQFAERIGDLERQSDAGLISRQQFIEAISDLLSITPDEVWSDYYGYRLYNEPAIAWARDIRLANDYKLALLSNIGRGWLDEFLVSMNQIDLFDEVILSSDVGIIKPNPKIFELMSVRLGLDPSECVMIDDVAANIDGAKSIGMYGIVFDSIDQAKADLQRLVSSQNA